MSATVASSNTADIILRDDAERNFTLKIDNPRDNLTINEIESVFNDGEKWQCQGNLLDKNGNPVYYFQAIHTQTTTVKEEFPMD